MFRPSASAMVFWAILVIGCGEPRTTSKPSTIATNQPTAAEQNPTQGRGAPIDAGSVDLAKALDSSTDASAVVATALPQSTPSQVASSASWPATPKPLSSDRVEVFFRNTPMTTASRSGALRAWSVHIPLDADPTEGVAIHNGKVLSTLRDCAPCELADSPLAS